MDKKEYAVELKHNGHNCCQSVLCAFADELGMSMEELDKMGAAFGGGMGCMEATCGSLCGAQMALGIKTFEGKPVLRTAAAMSNAFKEKSGATICKDLKGRDTGVVLCECDDCVRNAVEILEQNL
ncbi:MAG: C-GCAxxG-C-C family protein [Butyrivibrio sp.]|nr:C-GCAxxG-C-C family protein [Butyrivibrio sp.]